MTDPQPNGPNPGPAPEPPKPPEPPGKTVEELTRQLHDTQHALEAERKQTAKHDAELTKLKQSQMTAAEKAIEQARKEGAAEAIKAAGTRLAAAEFRARATGKLADPATLIEALDLKRFVKDDGEPDVKAIDAAVAKLTEAMGGNGKTPAPTVPGGPRPDPGEKDWLRSAMAGH